jgi:uncharacterized protein (TIGR03437 family)
MERSRVVLALNLALAVLALVLPARAETLCATVPLSPANEVPPVIGLNANGTAVVTLNLMRDGAGNIISASVNLTASVSFPGSVRIEGLRLQEAPVGANGEAVIVGQGVSPVTTVTFSTGSGLLNLDALSFNLQTLPRLIANPAGFYVNLYTSAHPTGALRGQLSRWFETLATAVPLSRENVNPRPGGLFSTGHSTVVINPTRDRAGKITGGAVTLATRYDFEDLAELPRNEAITGLRIHEGATGLNGPPRIDTGITNATAIRGNNGFISVTIYGVSAELLQRLVANPANFYVSLHTVTNPNGELRGQLTPFNTPNVIRQMSDYLVPVGFSSEVTLSGSRFDGNSQVVINGNGGNPLSLDAITGQLSTLLPPALLAASGVRYFQVRDNLSRLASKPQALVVAERTKLNPTAVANVDAARYAPAVAPESIVAAFGTQLASQAVAASTLPLPTTLDGTTVFVNGTPAPLFFVSPTQINYQLPPDVDPGTAQVIVLAKDGTASHGQLTVLPTAPAIFTQRGDGTGAPAAVAAADGLNFNLLVGNPDGTPRQLEAGVFVSLFGTGLRFAPNTDLNDQNGVAESLRVVIGGMNVIPNFAGAQGQFAGLDQINLQIPAALAGRGIVDLTVSADGKVSNTVKLNIK